MSILLSNPVSNDPLVPKKKPRKGVATASRTSTVKDEVAHVIVRVRSEDGLTITAHRNIINLHGMALFAKIGRGLTPAVVSLINQQIQQDVPTYLFIATFDGWKEPFAIYQCKLNRISTVIAPEQMEFVPTYLHGIASTVGTWFEICGIKRIAKEDIRRIHIFTSDREVSGALRGPAALFKVKISGTSDLKTVADTPTKSKSLRQIDDESQEFFNDDLDGDLDDIIDWNRDD